MKQGSNIHFWSTLGQVAEAFERANLSARSPPLPGKACVGQGTKGPAKSVPLFGGFIQVSVLGDSHECVWSCFFKPSRLQAFILKMPLWTQLFPHVR